MQPIVEVKNISKRYRLGHSIQHTNILRELLVRGFAKPWKRLRNGDERRTTNAQEAEFWALRDINFEVADVDRTLHHSCFVSIQPGRATNRRPSGRNGRVAQSAGWRGNPRFADNSNDAERTRSA